MGNASLELKEVWKSFETPHHEVTVLRGVSFSMSPGDAVCVTGPSGSGKSTLLHLIGTLDRPTRGVIRLEERVPHDLPEKELARFRNKRVGFVFQDHHLLPQYTVLENALLPTVAFPDGARDPAERAKELLVRVGLGERFSHRPAELSGGEKQRVALARALINSPSLLLCDEPTGNLDQATGKTVGDLLFELHGQEKNMLIVVTHSLELAGRFERRFQLEEGQCVEV